MSYESNIGQYVVSRDLGIGKISDLTEMSDNGFFYKVEFTSTNAINYFSVNNMNKYRILADVKDIKKAIKVFLTNGKTIDFDSTQEKINFYKKALQTNDIVQLAEYLSVLNQEEDIHTSIKKIFNVALESLVLEIQFVMQIPNKDAWKLLKLEPKVD
jgi:RNA polymerase-interacting CarD/CdnL/TRCF family regulator